MVRKRADYSDIHPSHADVTAVAQQVAAVAGDLDELEATVGTQGESIIGLQSTVGTVGDEVSALKPSVQSMETYLKNRVVSGIYAETSDTTTHGDGAAFVFDANVTMGTAVVDGVVIDHLGGKIVISSGDVSPLTAEAPDVKFMTVAFNNAGNTELRHVSGIPATEGAAVLPTNEQITTALGSDKWIPLFASTFHRVSDSAATGSMDNSVRRYF
jgi:hypothetical protein